MKYIYLYLIVICIITACGKKDCSNNKRFYHWGYSDGERLRFENKHLPDCDKFAKDNIANTPLLEGETESTMNCDCYCEGYNDGINSNKNAYPEEEESK